MKIVSIKKKKLDEPKQFYDVIDAHPYNNFLIKTNSNYICSHNCNFSDEVNWGITNDTEKLKKKYKQLISQIDARMKSRFMRQKGDTTYLPTLNIIASSKNSEQSFLEDYIQTKKKNESKNTLIVDEPQWVVDSRKDSATKFYVAIGNRFLANELLPLSTTKEELSYFRAKGYNILEVPIGYLENFRENIDGALMDIAGIATASSLKFISGARWEEAKVDTYKNLFVKSVIEVGTGDDLQYKDFCDLSRVPSQLKSKPLFIHLDMSTGSKGKGDKTGIGGVWMVGKRPKVEGEDSSRELYFKVAFSVSVKAPQGFDISFDKNRQFIRWLREQGFNVRGVSSDTFMAAQIQQQLSADKFNVSTISVDRLDTQTHQCLPYAYFKSTLYDKRVEVYRDCDLLTEEVLGLERESDGHINHPENGTQGCFTGDTKVSLVDGRELTFLELIDEFNNGKQNYVYSFNHTTKRIEPKLITNAWCTKKNAQLVEVELDNGEKLRCTPNHKFMLRDGSYCEAQCLTSGESLMPLVRNLSNEILNHKVRSVKFIDTREDVYDITVQDNHNFALSSGVFVHNSKDQVDGIVGALWNASQNAEEFAYEFGESLEALINANGGVFDKQKAMQEELNKMMSARYLNVEGKDNGLLMPKTPDKKVQATVNFQNIANGIMVW